MHVTSGEHSGQPYVAGSLSISDQPERKMEPPTDATSTFRIRVLFSHNGANMWVDDHAHIKRKYSFWTKRNQTPSTLL